MTNRLLWLPDRRASSGSSARLSGMCVVVFHGARQAGIFWFLGPPVWHVCCRVPCCQTGGHLLVPRPACLACVVVLHAARQAGIFWFLGPPVWHVCCRAPCCQTGGHLLVPRPACLACVLSCSMLPDRRASSGSSARLSGMCVVVLHAARQAGIFWFLGPPVWHVCCRAPCCQTGGHLLVPRPACLACVLSCSMLPDRRASSGSSARLSGMCVVVLHAARQAGIFWFLGPPVWHVCCRAPCCQTGGHLLVPRPACLACVLSCSMLPDRRASSGSSARLSGMCVVVLHAARQAGIFWFLGPPVWHVCCRAPCCQTGGHLLVPRPACLACVLSCSMLPDRRASSGSSARLSGICVVMFHAARQAGIFWFLGPPVWHMCCRVPCCQTGGHLLVPRPACLACVLSCSMLPDRRASSGSSARLSGMCVVVLHAARQAGIFWFLGPPVWHMCCRVPCCQTGGHLLVPRPACLAYVLSCSMLPDRRASSGSSARLSGMCVVVLHAARQAGIFWFLGPPVWHVLSCSMLPDRRASSGSSARLPGMCVVVFHAARQAGIFWFLGPPVWHMCCRVPCCQTGGHLLVPRPACLACVLSCSMLPDRRASSGSSARLSGMCCRAPCCQTGGHLLVPRPACLACVLSCSMLPDRRASSGSSARLSDSFSCRSPFPCGLLLLCVCNCLRHAECSPGDVNCL